MPFVNPRTGLPVRLGTTADAAAIIRASIRTIEYKLQRNELSRFKIGGLLRVDLNEVDALITLVEEVQP